MEQNSSTSRRPRSSSPLFWSVWAILVSVGVVALTRTGVDVLAVITICVVLLALERTVGDWLGELLGSGVAGVVFAAVVVLVAWYAAGARDRSELQYFLAAAESRGYRSYFWSPAPGSFSQSPYIQASQTPHGSGPLNATRAVAESPAGQFKPRPIVGDAREAVFRKGDGRRESVTSLMLSSRLAVTGEIVGLRAVVTAGEQPVQSGAVEFSVDGRVIETAALSPSGEAWSAYSSRVPGRFRLRARSTGGALGVSEAAAMLNVVPGQ